MAKQTINLGTMADNKSGDPLRTAFTKINQNFDELYAGAATGTATTVAKTGGGSINALTTLDLSKSINKLSAGYYSLANGTEGQILHVVKQTGNNDTTVIYVTNQCRIDGNEYTNNYIEPFANGNNVVTFIYTDGAWQSDNGLWD
jgi:hypothetical protein